MLVSRCERVCAVKIFWILKPVRCTRIRVLVQMHVQSMLSQSDLFSA